MTPDLDVDGPAAPPRTNGELAFEHPWQGRLFATTMALCDNGVVDYATFRDRLIEQIAARERHADEWPADEQPADEYWSSWQDALESLLDSVGVCGPTELRRRAKEFASHP